MNSSKIETALAQRVLVIDGAMGTSLQDLNLTAEDFGGAEYEGCNENLVLTRPNVIRKIHEDYLKSGCDIVETNTFGATPLVLDEYALGSKCYEINFNAARLAREACDQFSTAAQPRFVAGSIGPTTKAISVTGGVTFEELVSNFLAQSRGLWDGGADYFLLETCQDTRNIKAGLIALEQLFAEKGSTRPIAVSVTIEASGTMLGGQSIEALLISLANQKLLYLGLNCATGPEFMTDSIRTLAALSPFPVACVPNAGLPDENGCYLETPAMVSSVLGRFAQQGWLNVIGGCCGTHPGHIAALAALAKTSAPHTLSAPTRSTLSGIDSLDVTEDSRPWIVGERTNVIGSKKFRTLIENGQFDEATDVARAQIKNGAHVVDVCLANPDRNELEDMRSFLELATKKIKAPLMIDSTDADVIAMALTYSQGKAIINSINLEDGEERFEEVVPLAKRFGAALVVGTIDDDPIQGMGVSRARKLSIAERSYQLLTEKYGIKPEDIYWDPLVFPCGTGDAQYVGSALETIEGIKLIKARFPGTKTVLGISNVSFGLPASGREVLNSVFLYHCVQAGLDLAIVNSEKLERFAHIPTDERTLAEDLLFNRGADPVAAFAAHFRAKLPSAKKVQSDTLPLMERLPRYIIEGSKDGLVADLELALKEMKPLDIINGPLMKGMDEVGRLFNTNQLIVAEVLQSAEAMKASVGFLESFMEKTESSLRGTLLLATVKGDVHDIGKNLVEIIFSNNGFRVVNLGIKIPPEQLIQAAREHKPDLIGLSGLLVKSAQQMVLTAQDLKTAGVHAPVLVGGAALTQSFVDKQIAPAYGESHCVAYAPDAMKGLELAKGIVDRESGTQFVSALKTAQAKRVADALSKSASTVATPVSAGPAQALVEPLATIPSPPDWQRHILRDVPLQPIWKFINPLMLFGRHLGVKGGPVKALWKAAGNAKLIQEVREQDPKAVEIWESVQRIQEEYAKSPLLRANGVYQFLRASSHGDCLTVHPDGQAAVTFEFPRQARAGGLCLSDYVWTEERSRKHDRPDSIAAFVVTAGAGLREHVEALKTSGQYLKAHILQALAIETAEGFAESLHCTLRSAWGFPDPVEITMMERFQAKYHGKRYSFGYPACPRLDDQAKLWQILKPEDIGVQLTDGFMMDPESSVSAIVFHHPQASYFSVGSADAENRS